MAKIPDSCKPLPTIRQKIWCDEEYYIGDTDRDRRRSGTGENHWRGAESIEWYNGHFTRDTMNGPGEYRWRYRGPDGAFITYEGRFYANRMHGYGTMSYPDGRTFTGLYDENYRWGPGIESHVSLQEDVGFWSGNQLLRLAWRPAAPCSVLDLMAGYNGKATIEPFRIMMVQTSKTIGETNSAIELLKAYGADPLRAAEVWPKLYLKHSTDLESQACHVESFQYEFFNGKVYSLEEVTGIPEWTEIQNEDSISNSDNKVETYFAWNNSHIMVHMMKHCYMHEQQRNSSRIDLAKILNGSRKQFKPAGKHERQCRTLLMASYLGRIATVAQLINEENIHPDLADKQGNTALMLATCGDQAEVVHFLVEAGANVNSYNDPCCTPLGVALLRLMCFLKDIAPNMMVQAIQPPHVLPAAPAAVQSLELSAIDWIINREVPDQELNKAARRSFIKGEKKTKSILALGDSPAATAKKRAVSKQTIEGEYGFQDSLSEDRILYSAISEEYSAKVNGLFIGPNVPVPYIFEVHDMVTEVEANELLLKPAFAMDKKVSTRISKVIKDIKLSKEVLWTTNMEDDILLSENNAERLKTEMLSKMMLTILQLLADGADPRLVRCPQPALFIAVTAGCADLVRHLIHYGVDINETYSQTHGYTALDVAIARPFTFENVEIIQALLENGADANHRLRYHHSDVPGPTLLHAVLARKIESHIEEEILHDVIELLLEHNCNPGTQFNGRSAVDMAMTKSLDILDTFIKNPKTNLNEVINSTNQTVLVKMFSLSYFKLTSGTNRFPILTNLLLYGADPLIECHDGEKSYRNIIVFANNTLDGTEYGKSVPTAAASKLVKNKADQKKTPPQPDGKGKNAKGKSVSDPTKIKGKTDDIGDYKVALDLVTECARILHLRWLQTKIMKELISVTHRYKHRHWNMILKEHKNRKCVGLWLTPQRCLEIWDILKTTKTKLYKDDQILKNLLCIVQFCNNKSKLSRTSDINPTMTAVEKRNIESDVRHLLTEHKIVSKFKEHAEAWKGLSVKPELAVGVADKFKICFECALPLTETKKLLCTLCRRVSFCSLKCMKVNVDRPFCHPCSVYLKEKFSEEFGE